MEKNYKPFCWQKVFVMFSFSGFFFANPAEFDFTLCTTFYCEIKNKKKKKNEKQECFMSTGNLYATLNPFCSPC